MVSAKVLMSRKLQTLKQRMLAEIHNASPGQVVVTKKFFLEIYHTIIELEDEVFDDKK